MIVRPATLADVDAIALSEADNLGADAWSHGLVEEGVAGQLPTVHYLVAEESGRLLGHAVASIVAKRLRGGPAHGGDGAAPEDKLHRLTARERDVLGGVARGLSNRAIADELGITERTARTHVSNILAKLGLTSRTQAALLAAEHGLRGP